ncbi:hypothetical protein CYY_000166 [Polysphondylium violaceum]|uniref:Complex 1 LYR protein domain-containing protein n=1 Tax=Polysphondylium violaceum TaxID=133409 RepID=A0A8J4V9A2_9MYCE|nr:hypothetical protein CYY_000166 [Polysphondylium violaceum]
MCTQTIVKSAASIKKNSVHIYRDCIRLGRYIGSMNGFTGNMLTQVRLTFRKNMYEVDPEKIEEQKGDALRFMTNFMQTEAMRIASQHKAMKSSQTARTKTTLD